MLGVVDVGGGNRAAFGAGVLDYCLDKGIVFDYCIGVSAGSANCASYIAGQKGRNLRFYTKYNVSKEAVSLLNGLKTRSLLSVDYIFRTLSNEDGADPLNYDALTASEQDLKVVATDAATGEPVYFSKNDMERNDYGVLCASCNLPVVNHAYRFRGREYYDGGLSDPIPIDRALSEGCDQVVVILTLPGDYIPDSRRDRNMARVMRAYPRIREDLKRRTETYARGLARLRELEQEGKVLIIAPGARAEIDTLGRNTEIIANLYNEGYERAAEIEEFVGAGAYTRKYRPAVSE